MKLKTLSIAAGLLWLSMLVQAQDVQTALTQLPSCALSCLVQYVPQTACSLTNATCLCSNENLWREATVCSLGQCTTREALTAQKVSKTACNVPIRDHSIIMLITSPLLLAAATIFVVVRILARSSRRFELWGWDDSLIIGCWATGLPMTVFHILLVRNGLGKDIWEVPFDHIDNMLFYFYLGEPFYLFSTVLMKLSILAFYLRVFVDKNFRYTVYLVMGALLCFAIAFLFALTFQCSPVSYAWTHWDSEKHGSCINVNAGTWAHAALNIFFDLVVLVLPISQLIRPHFTYSWKDKAQIGIMFSTGFIVTIISALRLRSLILFANTQNPTWDYFAAGMWSAAEVFAGIICACLPTARVFIMRILPKWLGLTHKGSSVEPVTRRHLQRPAKQVTSWTKSSSQNNEPGGVEVTAEFIKLEDAKSRDSQ